MAILTPQTGFSVVTFANNARKQIEPLAASAHQTLVTLFTQFMLILNRYPPLKVLVFSLIGFSLIPLSVFVGFSVVSGSIVLGTSLTGFAIVQGFILFWAAFFLFWWLLGAAFFSGLTTFWFGVGYFGLKTAKKLSQ
ncbi:hypothetical protein EDD86DRAFT_196608 [Gorgonomyces haynaldii]|nr:hypothetical protein EDD86DRAFT_196608 [Gorgonomyces haynaldii]